MNENINQKSYKNTLLIIAGVLLVVAVALAALSMYKESDEGKNNSKDQGFSVSKTDLIDSKLPSGFPEDLPLEKDSKVSQNYEATTNDGRVQSTRVMSTTKTSISAIKTYTDFFGKLGWSVVPGSSTNESTVLMIKDSDTLLISTNESTDNSRSISLTLTASQ